MKKILELPEQKEKKIPVEQLEKRLQLLSH